MANTQTSGVSDTALSWLTSFTGIDAAKPKAAAASASSVPNVLPNDAPGPTETGGVNDDASQGKGRGSGGDKAKTGLDGTKTPGMPPVRLGGVLIVIRQDELVEADASGVMDFLKKAPTKMGGGGVLGHTTVDPIKSDLKTDSSGKVAAVTLTTSIKTRRVVGKGEWDTANAKAIHEVEAENSKHEKNHQKDFDRISADLFGPEFVNGLVGKTKAEADAEINKRRAEWRKQIAKSVKELDAKEGMTRVTQDSDGSFTVEQVGVQ